MSEYFVAPRLNEKKVKQYKKKTVLLKKKAMMMGTELNLKEANDDLDDELFSYSDLNYKIHSIPNDVYQQIPEDQLKNLPHVTNNPVIRNKYTTSIDSRNYLTTFEYKINEHHIIWDYNTGYIHLTGIWKALGNSKADILNLLDNAPELEPYLKRVRGGFLKIQGSWLNFDNCYKLACKICWDIRYALVPVFGIKFLHDVLKPNEFGYGELKLNSYLPGDPNDKTIENKKKRKRQSQSIKNKKLKTEAKARSASDSIPVRVLPLSVPTSKSTHVPAPASSMGSNLLSSDYYRTTTTPPLTAPCSLYSSPQTPSENGHQSLRSISNDEYHEMIIASNSLRNLKFGHASSGSQTEFDKNYRYDFHSSRSLLTPSPSADGSSGGLKNLGSGTNLGLLTIGSSTHCSTNSVESLLIAANKLSQSQSQSHLSGHIATTGSAKNSIYSLINFEQSGRQNGKLLPQLPSITPPASSSKDDLKSNKMDIKGLIS